MTVAARRWCCACDQRRALALSLFRGQVDAGTLKWACGLSHRQISRAISISVGAISAYAAHASAAGLDWAAVEALADDELEIRLDLLAQTAVSTRRVEPDYAAMHRDLRRKGVTLQRKRRLKAALTFRI
ncbi:hypothetical protein SAMN04487769_0064 [Burkholderia sp. b14]|nr:hypothetical protein SAMN04487769_0064 [Burkholderia sp. b14]